MAAERKPNEREPLQAAEDDGTMRLVEATRAATRAFGDPKKAVRWLRKPNRVLGGEKPIDQLTTARGAAVVRQLLGNIECGGIT